MQLLPWLALWRPHRFSRPVHSLPVYLLPPHPKKPELWVPLVQDVSTDDGIEYLRRENLFVRDRQNIL